MATVTFRQLWKNEYFKTGIMIILVIVVVFGFWYVFQLALSTQHPALAVATGSMCTLPGPYCDGWSHPFERTLHVGDLIIVQGVNPTDIKAAPQPDGDIIVFPQPQTDELIVHRAIANQTIGGEVYFRTQGDGNYGPDPWLISGDEVIGKVVFRIPWIGHISLFMHNSSGIYIILILLIILIIVEFAIPALTSKETETEPKKSEEKGEFTGGTVTFLT